MCKDDRGINLSALCEWKIRRHEVLLNFNTGLTDLPEEAKEGDLEENGGHINTRQPKCQSNGHCFEEPMDFYNIQYKVR